MKQIIFIFMSLLCFSCSSKAQNQILMYSPIRKSWLPISLVLELQKKPPMPLQKRLAANFIR